MQILNAECSAFTDQKKSETGKLSDGFEHCVANSQPTALGGLSRFIRTGYAQPPYNREPEGQWPINFAADGATKPPLRPEASVLAVFWGTLLQIETPIITSHFELNLYSDNGYNLFTNTAAAFNAVADVQETEIEFT